MATTSTQPAPKPSAQTKKAETTIAKQAPDPVAELARIETEIKDHHQTLASGHGLTTIQNAASVSTTNH